jgi:hypothetical protein
MRLPGALAFSLLVDEVEAKPTKTYRVVAVQHSAHVFPTWQPAALPKQGQDSRTHRSKMLSAARRRAKQGLST